MIHLLAAIATFFTLGDSLTNNPNSAPQNRWPVQLSELAEVPVVDLGAPGQTTAYVLNVEVPRITQPCAGVTIEAGANDFDFDLGSITLWKTYVAEYDAILAAVAVRCPQRPVALLTDVDDFTASDRYNRRESFERMNLFIRGHAGKWAYNYVVADVARDAAFTYPGPFMANVLHENQAGQALVAAIVYASMAPWGL